MPRKENPLALSEHIKVDDLKQVGLALNEGIRQAVSDCIDRDRKMVRLRAIRDGRDTVPTKGPWPKSCTIVDPLTSEHTTTMQGAANRSIVYPYCMFDAIDPGDDKDATDVQSWFNPMIRADGFEEAAQDAIYTCMDQPGAPVFLDWYQDTVQQHEAMVTDELSGAPRPATDDDDPDKVEMIATGPKVLRQGLRFRVAASWDVYPLPVQAKSPDLADGVVERLWITKTDIIRGMEEEGWNKDAGYEMLKKGSQKVELNDAEMEQWERAGVKPDGGLYECFQVIGRPPLKLDDQGRPQMALEYALQDCTFLMNPLNRAMLRSDLRLVPERPMVIVKAFTIPGQFWGRSVAEYLSSGQDEMTAVLRGGINALDFLNSAPLLVPLAHMNMYSGITLGPNKKLGVPSGGAITQLQLNPAAAELSLQREQWLYSRFSSSISSAGESAMGSGKVRKASEVQASQYMSDIKHGLIVSSIGRGFLHVFAKAIAMYMYYGQRSGNLQEVKSGKDQSAKIDVAQLKRKFRMIPTISSENSNPDQLTTRDLKALEVGRSSPLWNLPAERQLLAQSLNDMRIRDAESLLPDDAAVEQMEKARQQAQQQQAQGGGQPGQPGANSAQQAQEMQGQPQ